MILVTILGLNMFIQLSTFAQNQKTIVVKDENGNPVAGANVTVGEDAKLMKTNEKGEFTIPSDMNTLILLEAEGFDPLLTSTLDLLSVELIRKPYQLSEKDNIYLPFRSFKKRRIPGAVNAIDPSEIIRYDEQKSISGILNGRIPGLFGSSNIRGYGTPLYVINGIPRPAVDINPHEVEQITVIKDFYSGMMYGTAANNGVILITTKHGAPLKKGINFTIEKGYNNPIRYPGYLSASDYMTLYNEALANDGLDPKYSQTEIDSTKSGLNPVRFPDEDYYNSTYLKDWSSYRSIIGEVTGGTKRGGFYLNVGWNHSNGLIKVGEGANEKNDRLNMRSNINYQVADFIDFLFDGSFIFNLSDAPRYTGDDFWEISSSFKPNIYKVLIPSNLIKNEDLLAAAKLIDGKYVLGGTSEYLTNIYGELTKNGLRKSLNRLVEINTALNFDLSSITQGLNAKLNASFDMYNSFQEDMLNSYAIYRPNYTGDTLTSFTRLGTDVKVASRTVSDASYYRRYGFYGTLNYQRIFGDHEVNSDAVAYYSQYNVEAVRQPSKYLHFGLRANYMFMNKYIAELTGVYAGSSKFYGTETPYTLPPGIGLAWIISEEDFLKANSLVNYLKVRTNWSLINTDENVTNYNLWREYYQSSGSYSYFNNGFSNTGRIRYPGNADITWEKISNFNIGFESLILDSSLGIEGSYFYYKTYDIIARKSNSLPDFFGNLPYENFGSKRNQGAEISLHHDRNFGDLDLRIGVNFVYSVPKLLVADELKYPDKYRRTVGKPTDAIFGYVAEGLFKDQNEINSHAVQTFTSVQPGDIKYKDLNDDGFIDVNDQKMIGNSSARFEYGLNIKMDWRSFTLFVLGTGQTGQDRYFNSSYYWVYGDRKYSEVVWDRWTPATASSATYPRLSSGANANNFINSTFWLEKNNWFEIHTAQLTYTLSDPGFIGLKEVRIFLRGNNLVKLSKIREKTDLNVGSVPQLRVVSAGLNLSF